VPSYWALSYEWDLLPGNETIFVDGCSLSVRANLVAFLKILRDKAEVPALIWADAICINQTDIAERNAQLQLMRRIFPEAVGVLSWLGPAVVGSERAMQFCNEKSYEPNARRRQVQHGESEAALSFYRDVMGLCKLRYRTRLWIVPELLLGRDVVLHYGESTTPLDDFVSAVDWQIFMHEWSRIGRADWKYDKNHIFDKHLSSDIVLEMTRHPDSSYLRVAAEI
jgi:hypothetical protein